MAEPYRRAFADLTAQSADALLDAVGAGPGVRLLDLACGPGHVAAAAARRGAEATGVDFAASMVSAARARFPNVRFQEGDAEALELDDASFDAAVMNFGLLHLGRPERALAEAHRVLRAGGRFAFTVWAPPDRALAFGFVLDAVRRLGNPDVPLPPGPPFFRFSEAEESRRALLAAGFLEPGVSTLPLVWTLPDAEALFHAMSAGTVRTRGLLSAQTPGALARIRHAVIAAATPYARGDRLELPMPCVLASARRA